MVASFDEWGWLFAEKRNSVTIEPPYSSVDGGLSRKSPADTSWHNIGVVKGDIII